MTKKLKVAILIIAANFSPSKKELSSVNYLIYKGLDVDTGYALMNRWQYEQSVWKTYMNRHPQIDCFFIYGDETQDREITIEKNIIRVKVKDSFIPGILIKTCKALEALKGQYDYYIRTNTSTLFHFDRLLEQLNQLPQHQYYGGALGVVHRDDPLRHPTLRKILYKLSGGRFTPFFPKPKSVMGYCIVFSADVIEKLTFSYQHFTHYFIPDDHIIASMLEVDWGIKARSLPHSDPKNQMCLSYQDFLKDFVKKKQQACFFRIKPTTGQSERDTRAIAAFLLKAFYDINLSEML